VVSMKTVDQGGRQPQVRGLLEEDEFDVGRLIALGKMLK
jgi:hypothetical protein